MLNIIKCLRRNGNFTIILYEPHNNVFQMSVYYDNIEIGEIAITPYYLAFDIVASDEIKDRFGECARDQFGNMICSFVKRGRNRDSIIEMYARDEKYSQMLDCWLLEINESYPVFDYHNIKDKMIRKVDAEGRKTFRIII